MLSEPVFDVSGAVAALNQTLEFAYPTMIVVGELSSFKVAKNRWVYADLKDEQAKVRIFGTIYQLPGPLEDGMMIEITAQPRLHPQFGLSLNIQSMRPVGEGSIKKAANLLQAKLEKEGLFAPERKRLIPSAPERVGLVASEQSAAYADFVKILNARWQGVEVEVYDAQVQGDAAAKTLIAGLRHFNELSDPPEVIVMIRGGGSVDDLAVFSTEQVTRSVAASRIPTVVAIGHEVDVSFAELAADLRASTPSNAAELLFPDKLEMARQLSLQSKNLTELVLAELDARAQGLIEKRAQLQHVVQLALEQKQQALVHAKILLESVHPKSTLKRGYALVEKDGRLIAGIKKLDSGTELKITMQDGSRKAEVK